MTLTTRPLRLHLQSVIGAPLGGAKVTLHLSSYQADGIEIVPLVWTLTEDPLVTGDYIGPIWPNTRTNDGTHYDLLVQANEQKLLTHLVTVAEGGTEAVLNLKINPPPYPPVYGAQAATDTANNFADAAGTSATLAAQYAQGLGDVSGAVTAAQEAAQQAALAEAQRLAYEDRVYPGVYSTPPTNKPHSAAPSAEGDRCVILIGGTPYEHLRLGGGWVIPNIDSANLALPGGSSLVGYDGGTAQDILDSVKPLTSYAALRSYTGRASGVRITAPGIGGQFWRDAADVSTADDGGTVIVDGTGRRWKREFLGAASVMWWGCKGDGVTDDTTNLQAAFNAMRGRSILIPPGSFVHADLRMDGATYNGTWLRCEGELKLKQRPAGGSTFGGAWVGFLLRDVSNVTIDYKGDGNRAAQPMQEHAFLVAIAGGSGINFPTFFAREVRGDGIYINQLNWASASAIPENITFGQFSVVNSADDGRNAMSIISASRVSIGDFKSIRVGGMVGITQPGGLDLEPNHDFQTIDSVHVGAAYIDTAGNFGFQAIGQARSTLGGNIRGFSAGKVHVIARGTAGSLTPVSFRHCQDVSVDFFVDFQVPSQQAHVALYVDNARNLKLNGVTAGGALGARIGYGAQVKELDLKIVCRNYSYAAVQAVLLSNSKVDLTAQTEATPVSWMPAALYVRSLTFSGPQLVNVDFTVNCPKSATTGVYGCFNETTNLATFDNVRFIDGNLRGYPTLERAFGGYGVGVKRINVAGVNDGTAPPPGGSGAWDAGNEVKNSVPAAGGVPGWVCTAAGSPGTWKALPALAA